ncbi:biopolymer transporter ExbD [Brevundimonas sp. M20]|uniref:ExbD/TolR family protein n=1 Tax=Brevundimonas sp. M20 TaxID=2591463 RepID=UPI00114798CF|nr:biopolymer transporter ExbD [Brevundimonas sp. M20]QDH73965.1 biopolymer transporter ExbD [Brevundimonas sp. M20]
MGARVSGPGEPGGAAVEQNADINVTPFVDIMLVLLIIFMVAAPVATVSLKLDLPPAEAPPAGVKPKEPVYVSVQEDGRLFLADRETSMDRLSADVCAATGQGEACHAERVFIRAQPEVRYDRFMAVMNGLKASGFDKVGLLNEDIE